MTADSDRHELARILESARNVTNQCQLALTEISELKQEARKQLRQISRTNTTMNGMVSKVDDTIARVGEQAAEIKERSEIVDEQKEMLISLQEKMGVIVSSATSIKLAEAFHERKKTFRTPSQRAYWLFVVSILAIIIFSAATMFGVDTSDGIRLVPAGLGDTSPEVGGAILSRLSVIAPLVWLAFFASRRQTQALRLEEEYAHKEALSASFDGYKEEIRHLVHALPDDAPANHPLIKLINNTLDHIARSPSRIYKESKETSLTKSLVRQVRKLASTQGAPD